MATKIDTSKTAPENCPRFEYCQINKCPLDSSYSKLKNDPSDPAFKGKKQKCVHKGRRLKIAKHYPELKNKGLTPREQSSMKMWNSLTEAEKQAKINKIRGLSPISRLLASGHTIIPPHNKQSQNPHINQEKSSVAHTGEGALTFVQEVLENGY